MEQKSRLMVFEGADGAGKSSLSSAFLTAYRELGNAVELLSFPGKRPKTIGELVYRLHHAPQDVGVDSLTPGSLQAMHIAAHLDAIETVIVPALESGTSIILDRFWWSTWVYGSEDGIKSELLKALIEVERIAWGKWQPSIVFHVTRGEPLRPEPIEKWHQLKGAYSELAHLEHGNYPIHTLANEKLPESAVAEAIHIVRDK